MRILFGAALAGVLAIGTASSLAAQPLPATANRQRIIAAGARLPGAANAYANRQLICRGGSIPEGWVLVDDVRDPAQCEGANPSALRLYNVWVIERFDDRMVGTIIDICAATPIPDGWALVDVYRAKELCGHPDAALTVNVKRIRRIR